MPEPLISLSTIIPDREVIRIDDEDYELAASDDLSLIERRSLNTAWRRMMEIENKEDITKTEDVEYSNLTRKLVGMLLPTLPKEVLRVLPRSSQEAVVVTFFGKPTDPRMRAMLAMMNQAGITTGDTQSQDSNDSTAETPSDGSISQLDS